MNATEAEHMVARNGMCNVPSHIAANGTCPCLFCSHDLLAAAGWENRGCQVVLLQWSCSRGVTLCRRKRDHNQLDVPGCKSPQQILCRKPSQACDWAVMAALGNQVARTLLTSAAAGALGRALAACTRQDQGIRRDAAGSGTEMLQAAPGTTQHSTAKNLLDLEASHSCSARSRNEPD